MVIIAFSVAAQSKRFGLVPSRSVPADDGRVFPDRGLFFNQIR
jgi:hypothetical protein